MNKQHKLWYQSSYDRGLEHLLKLWQRILEKFPDATLDIAYGWDVFDTIYHNNPERQDWKRRMQEMMTQKGITEHGKISKDKLKELRSACGIWAYPTHFTETFCISAVEAQLDGLVPVTVALAGLKETVKAGALVDGDIYDEETQEAWLAELFKYMSDRELWEKARQIGEYECKQYDWSNIAEQWLVEFEK